MSYTPLPFKVVKLYQYTYTEHVFESNFSRFAIIYRRDSVLWEEFYMMFAAIYERSEKYTFFVLIAFLVNVYGKNLVYLCDVLMNVMYLSFTIQKWM